MSRPRHLHTERSPRKKPSERFFKELLMPPVGHAKGAVPEQFQTKANARSFRFAVICCALAVLIFGFLLGFVQLRKVLRNRLQPVVSPVPKGQPTSSSGSLQDRGGPRLGE